MTEITTQQVGLPAPQDVRLQVDWRNFDFADRERLVSAIRNTEQVASLMAAVRLYLLAGAMQSGYDWIAMREIVVEATGTSIADADEWILVASRLGYDLLRRAMEDVEREQGTCSRSRNGRRSPWLATPTNADSCTRSPRLTAFPRTRSRRPCKV